MLNRKQSHSLYFPNVIEIPTAAGVVDRLVRNATTQSYIWLRGHLYVEQKKKNNKKQTGRKEQTKNNKLETVEP